MLGADGIHAIITSGELVGSNTTGALSVGWPTACLHLGEVVVAREGHVGVEVPRHITRADTAILRSRGEGPVDVKGTARDQLLGSDIAGLQNSRRLRREDVPPRTTAEARILASVVIAEKAPTYETGAEKTWTETEAARTRRATLDARIVGTRNQ